MTELLALARAVYPDTEWFDDAGMCWLTAAERTGRAISGFDPANNSDQAIEVLAWLLRGPRIEVDGDSIFTYDEDRFIDIVYAQHDGTASGLRMAIVEAAMRVLE